MGVQGVPAERQLGRRENSSGGGCHRALQEGGLCAVGNKAPWLRRMHRIGPHFGANSTGKNCRYWEFWASLTVTSALSLDAFLLLTHVHTHHTHTHTHTLHTLTRNILPHTRHTDTTHTHHTQHSHTLIHKTHTTHTHYTHTHTTHTCHPPQTTCTHTHAFPTVYQIVLAQEPHPGKSSL